MVLTKNKGFGMFFLRSGGVAQLARAFEWHSKGQGFDSPHLQNLFKTLKSELH